MGGIVAAKCEAFISYGRADSAATAVVLHHAIERFAKRWNQLRAVRVFRDDDSMSANAGLWSTIESALEQSRYFILIASPAAAASSYVDRETAWWLQHKSAHTVLVALHRGELHWLESQRRFLPGSALPPSLLAAFAEEPRWTDLRWVQDDDHHLASDPRLASAVADLAAPIHGTDRDELFGENVAQHRRARRLARSAIAGLVGLLVASIVLATVALWQRNDVLRQARSLLARQLSTTAVGLLDTDLRTAGQLAAEAFLTEDTAVSRATLTQAMLASPHLDHFIPLGGEITAMSASGDGRVVVAALSDGRVISSAVMGSPAVRCTTEGGIAELRVDRSGDTVVALGAAGVTVCPPNATPYKLKAPSGAVPRAVAVSPGGRSVAITFTFLNDRTTGLIEVFAAGSTEAALSVDDPLYNAGGDYQHLSDALAFHSETQLALISQNSFWCGLDLESRQLSENGGVKSWEPNRYVYRGTDRGDFMMRSATTNGDGVAIWRMDDRELSAEPPLLASVRMTEVRRMTMNDTGSYVLVDDPTGLFLARTYRRGQPAAERLATRLPGVAATSGMQFLANTGMFATSSGSAIAIWRIDTHGRNVHTENLHRRATCTSDPYPDDCRSSTMVLSPTGTRVAVVDNQRPRLELLPGPGQTGPRTSTDLPDARFFPVWTDDDHVLLVTNDESAAQTKRPATVPTVRLDTESAILAAQAVSTTKLLVVLADGTIQWVNSETGEPERSYRVPIRVDSDYPLDGSAFSHDHTRLVLWRTATYSVADDTVGPGQVWVVDPMSGEIQATIDHTGQVVSAAVDSDTLAIQYGDNRVDLIADNGTGAVLHLRMTGDNPGSFVGQRTPIVTGLGLFAIPLEHSIQLVDTRGQTVAIIPTEDESTTIPHSYALSTDGDALLIGYYGTTRSTALVASIQLDPEEQIRSICKASAGPIDLAQWDRLVGVVRPQSRACE